MDFVARALIIDDETTARSIIRGLLAEHVEIEVVGEAATTQAARELLRTARYDLVFLDIHLEDGDAFDLMPEVHRKAQVVFVTGANHHALRAFEVNALDYVVKPVTRARLAESIRRFGRQHVPRAAVAAATSQLEAIVQLSSSSRARFAEVGEINAIEAQENYTRVHLQNGESILVRRTLKAWTEILPDEFFVRVHRTMIVNLARISGYRRSAPKTVLLTVKGLPEAIAVGRQFWPALLGRLNDHFPAA